MRHEVRTDSATRFEKGIDPSRVDLALSLAMQMFAEAYPEMNVISYHDNYPQELKRKEINISLNWLKTRLGKEVSEDFLKNKLGRLGFDISIEDDKLHVIAPTWRSTGDISIAVDIVEEIARMYGYEHFEPTPILTIIEGSINQTDVDLDRRIREYLAFRCGMTEVFTYAWSGDEYLSALYPDISQMKMLELSTPPSQNERYLRPSLLPNLCKAVSDNLRYFNEFAIFESAEVFLDDEYSKPYDERESLPLQKKHTAGAFVGKPDELEILFRKAKGALENLPRLVHSESFVFEQVDKPVWADDVVWLNISTKGDCLKGSNSRGERILGESKKIGELALLSRKAALACGVKNASVILFEIDIGALNPLASRTNAFEHISEYPTTELDFSMLFDLPVKWGEIYDIIAGKKGPDSLIQDVLFVEEYKGKQIPENKKSVTIRLVIGSTGKTLTSDEIEKCANAVSKRLEKRLGAVLR